MSYLVLYTPDHSFWARLRPTLFWLRKYPNLFKEQAITRPEQVWVRDINYIKTGEGNCYLNLITDVYSRKIMGYALADSMDSINNTKSNSLNKKSRRRRQSGLSKTANLF
jgi:transposase InsO family protein